MFERELTLALVRLTGRASPERRDEVRRLAREADADRLIELLTRTRLLSTLGPLLASDPEVAQLQEVTDLSQRALTVSRARGLMHLGLTGRITAALAEEGIAVLPLKGATLASALFGDVGRRKAADIDLLVRPEDLDGAAAVICGLGWHLAPGETPSVRPRLHRVLKHETYPPVELHWRVHWYESEYAERVLDRARPGEDGWLRATLPDELAFLLLFLARDGFAGLRQAVDVIAWWGVFGDDRIAAEVRAIAGRHPALEPALATAAEFAEGLGALPSGVLLGGPRPRSARRTAALRLSNPWLRGSRQQIDACVSLVDGLLNPPGELGAYVRRQILPPDETLIRRDPELAGRPGRRLHGARAAHAARMLTRSVPEAGRLVVNRRR